MAIVGETTFQNSISVSLGKSHDKISVDEDFDNYDGITKAFDYGWYKSTSDFYGNGHAPNGWFIKQKVVTDRANKDFSKSFVFGCDPDAQDSWLDNNGDPHSDLKFGFRKFNGVVDQEISGNKATISWHMYVEKNTIPTFTFSLGYEIELGKRIFVWDNIEKKIKWDVTGEEVYTAPKLGYWQKYELMLDISSTSTTKATLKIDGDKIFADRVLTNTVPSFSNFIWYMIPDLINGSCVGIDEITIAHTIPRPGFGEGTFYHDGASTTDVSSVSADVNAVAVIVKNGLLPDNMDKHISLLENGKELVFFDDAGDAKKASVKLVGEKLWIVPPRPLLSNTNYTVRLKKSALFADNVAIGYDQDFEFQTGTATIDVINTEYYKNGIKIANPSDITFAAGDKIKVSITLCNGTDSGYPVHILMLGYNGTMLSGYESMSATITAGATDQEVETPEITISSPTEFSATAIVCDSDFLPIADSKSVSGNQ